MKSNMNQIKWMRGLGNASYIIGAAFLIAAIMTNIVPPAVAVANQPISQLYCETYQYTDQYTCTANQHTDQYA